MNNYIIFNSAALSDETFLNLVQQYGKVLNVSKDGQKTIVEWQNENFDFIDNVNIFGPFSKEDALSNF